MIEPNLKEFWPTRRELRVRLTHILCVGVLCFHGLHLRQARAEAPGEDLEDTYAHLQADYKQSQAWQLLTRIAAVAQKLGRNGEALMAYESALTLGGTELDPEERARLEREVGALKEGSAWLTLNVTGPSGEFTLVDIQRQEPGEKSLTNIYKLSKGSSKLLLSAGSHHLSLAIDKVQRYEFELELQAGTQVERNITLLPPQKAAPPPALGSSAPTQQPARAPKAHREGSFVPAYISFGVTSALLGATIYSGVQALDKRSEYDAVNDGHDPLRAARLRDEGTRLNLITDVMVGATALGAMLTLVLYQSAAHPEVRHQRPVQKPRPRTILGVRFGTLRGVTPNQVTLSAEF